MMYNIFGLMTQLNIVLHKLVRNMSSNQSPVCLLIFGQETENIFPKSPNHQHQRSECFCLQVTNCAQFRLILLRRL